MSANAPNRGIVGKCISGMRHAHPDGSKNHAPTRQSYLRSPQPRCAEDQIPLPTVHNHLDHLIRAFREDSTDPAGERPSQPRMMCVTTSLDPVAAAVHHCRERGQQVGIIGLRTVGASRSGQAIKA